MLSVTRAARLVCVVAGILCPTIARAQTPETPPRITGPLTLEQALALSERYAPALRAAGARADAARARVGDARRRPNPRLLATEENFGGGLGGSRREGTLALGQTLEWGGDRRARTEASEADHALARAEARAAGWQTVADAAERFIVAWSLQERIARLREGEALTRDAVTATAERHRAGAVPRYEVIRAANRGRAQALERDRVETELGIARRELALCWGDSVAAFDSLVTPAFARDVARPGADLASHPDLQRASARVRQGDARVREAEASRIPDLDLSGGVRRLEEAGATGFIAGVEFPLPLWNGGGDRVTAARGERDAARADVAAEAQRLRFVLDAARRRAATSRARCDTLALGLLPARQGLVDDMLDGYRAGRSSYLDLIAEQHNLIETALALIDAQADLWRDELRLDLLTGTGVAAPKESR